jgi:sec-independent protein translocase protein TatB
VFDISFAELMIIAVVALLVIGPEKLPKVARTMGAYAGRLQRYVAQIKEEVNREVRFEELQKLQQEIKLGANKVESSLMAGAESVKDTMVSVEASVKSAPGAKKPAIKKAPVKKTTTKKTVAKAQPVKNSVVNKPATKKAIVKPNTDKV